MNVRPDNGPRAAPKVLALIMINESGDSHRTARGGANFNLCPAERAAATRVMCVPLLGRALRVRATGAVASCAAGGAGVRWAKPDLAWEFGREATWERCFESSRRSSVPAAGQRRRLGEGGGGGGHERANGF
jgi:hypothetical protein